MFFIVTAHVLSFVAMATLSFHRLIMGKVEIGIYFCVTADILKKKFYRNVSGVILYQLYEFCPNHWFWLVAMSTEKQNFQRSIKKFSPHKP